MKKNLFAKSGGGDKFAEERRAQDDMWRAHEELGDRYACENAEQQRP